MDKTTVASKSENMFYKDLALFDNSTLYLDKATLQIIEEAECKYGHHANKRVQHINSTYATVLINQYKTYTKITNPGNVKPLYEQYTEKRRKLKKRGYVATPAPTLMEYKIGVNQQALEMELNRLETFKYKQECLKWLQLEMKKLVLFE